MFPRVFPAPFQLPELSAEGVAAVLFFSSLFARLKLLEELYTEGIEESTMKSLDIFNNYEIFGLSDQLF